MARYLPGGTAVTVSSQPEKNMALSEAVRVQAR